MCCSSAASSEGPSLGGRSVRRIPHRAYRWIPPPNDGVGDPESDHVGCVCRGTACGGVLYRVSVYSTAGTGMAPVVLVKSCDVEDFTLWEFKC